MNFLKDATHYSDPTAGILLEERRDQILQEIWERNKKFPQDTSLLSDISKEHNCVSDELESLRLKPFGDPLMALPAELWVPILQKATQDMYCRYPYQPMGELLTLTLVCKAWCDAILATPAFWRTIYVGQGLGVADSQAQLATSLYLSRELPLDVTIQLPARDWELTMELLCPHSKRIRCLCFERGKLSDGLYANSLQEIILSFDQLPLLRSLTATGVLSIWDTIGAMNWQAVFERTPHLHEISGLDLPLEYLEHPTLEQLRIVQLRAMVPTVLPHIHSLIYSPNSDLLQGQLDGTRLKSLPNRDVLFPVIRTFQSEGLSDPLTMTLISTMSHLTYLELTCGDVGLFTAFLRILHRFPLLTTLHLTVPSSLNGLKWPGGEIYALQRLRTLRLLPRHLYSETREEDPNDLELIPKILAAHFPNVEHLTVNPDRFDYAWTTYVRSLDYLRHLELHRHQRGSSSIIIQSNTLERFTSRGSLSLLDCPALSRCHLHLVEDWHHFLTKDSELKRGFCARVTDINLFTNPSSWWVTTFSSLRRLEISTGNTRNPGVFWTILLQNSLQFPALEEIGYSPIPEWDILFLVLEGRNFLPKSHQIAPIKTLNLSYPPHPVIAVPLMELLGRRYATRPSNHDLSISGITEVHFDPNISGCTRCIEYMHACEEPIARTGVTMPKLRPRYNTGAGTALTPETGTTLTPEIQAWLEARDGRYEAWNIAEASWGEQGMQRLGICDKMRPKRTIQVTGFGLSYAEVPVWFGSPGVPLRPYFEMGYTSSL